MQLGDIIERGLWSLDVTSMLFFIVLLGVAMYLVFTQFTRLSAKMESISKELNTGIQNTSKELMSTSKELNDKIESTSKELNTGIQNTSKELNSKIESTSKELKGEISRATESRLGFLEGIFGVQSDRGGASGSGQSSRATKARR
jgi:predicted PurR-regulated permease PerM